MTKFSDSVEARIVELIDVGRNVCKLTTDACNAKGKPCEISFLVDPSFEFNAFAELLNPDTKSGLIFGGSYEVTVNKGVIYKLAYYFEMATSIFQRLEKDGSPKPLRTFVHTDQSEIAAKQLVSPNFFGFDLDQGLFALDEEEGFFSQVEAAFWPFWFGKREISDAAFFFVKQAFQFLVLHECAHVSRGHFEYLETQTRMPAIPLKDRSAGSGLTEEMVKAMEIDADQQALFNVLHEASRMEISNDVLLQFEGHLFVVALLYGVFDLRVRTASTYVGASHPDPDLRYYLTTTYMMIALTGMTGRDYKEPLEGIFERVILNVVRIQRELGVLGGGYSVYLASLSDEEARRIFVASSSAYLENAQKLEQQWVHRIGENVKTIAKMLKDPR